MVKERYYLIEKVKNCSLVEAFAINILKQTGDNLEIRSSIGKKLDEIGIKLEGRKVVLANDDYKIKKVAEYEKIKTLGGSLLID